MNNSQTLEQLKELRLSGMYEHYKNLLKLPAQDHPDAHQLIAMRDTANFEHSGFEQTVFYQ